MAGTLSQVLMGLSFLVNLAAVGSLWWAARRAATGRPFWLKLAAAWTLALLGNLAWIAIDLISTQRLPPLSWVDGFYAARYLLIGLALWQHPAPWPARRGVGLAAVMLAAGLVLWFGYMGPVWQATAQPVAALLGVAIYPVLDIGLAFCAWMRVAGTAGRVRQTMLLIGLAMTAYGAANLINFWVRLHVSSAGAAWASMLWTACDLLVVFAALPRPTDRRP